MLFETGMADEENSKSYLFSDPLAVICAYDLPGLVSAFQKIEKYSENYYLAGYIAYEAGYYFENEVFRPKKSLTPLLEFCVYKKSAVFDHLTGLAKGLKSFISADPDKSTHKLKHLCYRLSRKVYKERIKKIKRYIASGDTYQVNFTSKIKFELDGEPFSFYKTLRDRQRVSYGAFMNFGQRKIISLSPELFANLEKGVITSKPMKGTIRRGVNNKEDEERIEELKNSVKNRAENIMIVDMIRNDLGRICKTGSVITSKIFEVEKYNTLFQMVTTVKGRLLQKATYYDIFKSIFPGGSITGAPKLRTMQIIRELENEPRRVYCGALGIIFPGKEKKAVFNIPIRTVLLEKKRGELGVGGGVVWDSSASGEYAEARLKAKFLEENVKIFKLLETLLWDNGYFLLAGHLRRLKGSALYFSCQVDLKDVRKLLKRKEKEFSKGRIYRVRLQLSKDGSLELSASEIKEGPAGVKIVIAKHRTDSRDRFLYHKTTNRALYDSERAKIKDKGISDVIFLNEKNEVTEGAITNIFVKKNGKYFTPPISSGLLPGVYRDYFIKKTKALEKQLFLRDLYSADSIILVNSVRKEIKVHLS